jgi:hypothetical protein
MHLVAIPSFSCQPFGTKAQHAGRPGACLAFLVVLTGLMGWEAAAADHPLTPVGLRCEFADTPLGVDTPHPGLSWKLESQARNQRQCAYQILAASSTDLLAQDTGDLWDSGRVTTNETIEIPYQGRQLKSAEQIFWKVRVWNQDGKGSAWSEPVCWEMGLLSAEDWQAQWLNDGKSNPAKDEDFTAKTRRRCSARSSSFAETSCGRGSMFRDSTTPDMVLSLFHSFWAFFVIPRARGGDPNLSAFFQMVYAHRLW